MTARTEVSAPGVEEPGTGATRRSSTRRPLLQYLFLHRGGQVRLQMQDGTVRQGYIRNRVDGELFLAGGPEENEGLAALPIDQIEDLEVLRPPAGPLIADA